MGVVVDEWKFSMLKISSSDGVLQKVTRNTESLHINNLIKMVFNLIKNV